MGKDFPQWACHWQHIFVEKLVFDDLVLKITVDRDGDLAGEL
jgi:hypothetical protein